MKISIPELNDFHQRYLSEHDPDNNSSRICDLVISQPQESEIISAVFQKIEKSQVLSIALFQNIMSF